MAQMTLILGRSYYTLLPRLTHLAAGVLAACAALTPTTLGCLSRHKGIHNATAAAGLALVTVLTKMPAWILDQHRLQDALN